MKYAFEAPADGGGPGWSTGPLAGVAADVCEPKSSLGHRRNAVGDSLSPLFDATFQGNQDFDLHRRQRVRCGSVGLFAAKALDLFDTRTDHGEKRSPTDH